MTQFKKYAQIVLVTLLFVGAALVIWGIFLDNIYVSRSIYIILFSAFFFGINIYFGSLHLKRRSRVLGIINIALAVLCFLNILFLSLADIFIHNRYSLSGNSSFGSLNFIGEISGGLVLPLGVISIAITHTLAMLLLPARSLVMVWMRRFTIVCGLFAGVLGGIVLFLPNHQLPNFNWVLYDGAIKALLSIGVLTVVSTLAFFVLMLFSSKNNTGSTK